MKTFHNIQRMVNKHVGQIRSAGTEKSQQTAWKRYRTEVEKLIHPLEQDMFALVMMDRIQELTDKADGVGSSH